MGRRTFAVAIVTALLLVLLLLLHACPCAAARPLSTRPAMMISSEESAFALAPSPASEGAQWRARAAAGVGMWIPCPFAGAAVHYPVGYSRYLGYPEAKPMLWAGGTPPALGVFGAGAGGQFGKAPPYVDVTQQEQVAMWASLLNPSQRPATPASAWQLPANGGEQAEARDEPKALVAAEGAEMDVPAGGGGVLTSLPKWGLYPGNNNGR